MHDFVSKKELEQGFKIETMTSEERQGLVAVFAWLIQEDKRQNPEPYNLKKQKT